MSRSDQRRRAEARRTRTPSLEKREPALPGRQIELSRIQIGQPALRVVDERFLGTFLPARRASDKPIAMACFRLLTLVPERPLFNVPRLRSCMAFATFLDAASLYFRAMVIPLH